MKSEPLPQTSKAVQPVHAKADTLKTFMVCVAGICLPGLGHVLLQKWDRAIAFFGSISVMFALGLYLHGRLFAPRFTDLFSILKFVADAGVGSLYWISWLWGLGTGLPRAYTYDFANIFVYVAGLLNMLVVVDAYDIAMGRKP